MRISLSPSSASTNTFTSGFQCVCCQSHLLKPQERLVIVQETDQISVRKISSYYNVTADNIKREKTNLPSSCPPEPTLHHIHAHLYTLAPDIWDTNGKWLFATQDPWTWKIFVYFLFNTVTPDSDVKDVGCMFRTNMNY